jgi:hydroxymethylpyrimidine pyrophosphatase-like HAD family hydrolase
MSEKYDKTKTLFITDLDGTLLGKNATLSSFSSDTIARLISGGYNFTVATARTPKSVAKILSGALPVTPAVLMCGVLVYDFRKREFLRVMSLGESPAKAIIELSSRYNADALMYTIGGGAMEVTRRYVSGGGATLERIYNEDADARLPRGGENPRTIYFTFVGTRDKLLPLYDEVTRVPGVSAIMSKDDYTPDMWFVECFCGGMSKGGGVRFLRETYGFERVVAFGDNVNDIPMFSESDESYATSNAKLDAKAAATGVIGDNGDDAVARWLIDNVLD